MCLFQKCSEDLLPLSSTSKAAQRCCVKGAALGGPHRSPLHALFVWPLTGQTLEVNLRKARIGHRKCVAQNAAARVAHW